MPGFLLGLLWGLVLLLGAPSLYAAPRSAWTGVVTYVTDGDTLWVRADGASEARKIRLRGLDAPEICQAGGPQARQLLAERVLHREVQVQTFARDRYGRLIAQLRVDDEDLAAFMVREGGAWAESHVQGRGRSPYSALQAQARRAQRGLWGEAALPEHPAAFRQRHGTCQAGPGGSTGSTGQNRPALSLPRTPDSSDHG